MNLYAIKIETNTVVFAENERAALAVVDDNRNQMIDSDDIKLMHQIVTFDDLPAGWDANCIPWGQDEDKDIAQILANPMYLRILILEREQDLLKTELKNALARAEKRDSDD